MIFGAIFCVLLGVFVSAVRGGPTTSSNRFLFVIDTSAGMKPMDMKLRETLFDFIYSGARGRMTNGDTYGIWLVNERNETSFPMETWKRQHIVEIGAKAVSHMKDHGFSGKAHFELAFADLQNVLKNVGDLTVILISDGNTPILGTPFDEDINAQRQKLVPALKRAKATLNIALVAQDGKFVAWAANSPEFLIEIPVVAPKPKPAKVEIAVSKSNAVDSVSAADPAPELNSVPAPKPRIASAPIIITKESVAQERRSYLSSTALVEAGPAAAAPANAIPDVVTATATNLAAVANTNTSNVEPLIAATEVPASKPAPARASLAAIAAEPVSIESVALAPTKTSAPPRALSESNITVRMAFLWASVGAGAMLGCVIIVLNIRRRSRHEPSLISEALVRERLFIR